MPSMRWNDTDRWIWSTKPTHQPLVDQATYQAAAAGYRGLGGLPQLLGTYCFGKSPGGGGAIPGLDS